MVQACDAAPAVRAVWVGVRARSNANPTPALGRGEAPLRASARGCGEDAARPLGRGGRGRGARRVERGLKVRKRDGGGGARAAGGTHPPASRARPSRERPCRSDSTKAFEIAVLAAVRN